MQFTSLKIAPELGSSSFLDELRYNLTLYQGVR